MPLGLRQTAVTHVVFEGMLFRRPFFDRPSVQNLVKDIPLKGITTVHVHELSRLGRNLQNILETVTFLSLIHI